MGVLDVHGFGNGSLAIRTVAGLLGPKAYVCEKVMKVVFT
jgi:hypothetical protein